MRELIWINGQWYHPHCPGVSKASVLDAQYNLALPGTLANIDSEHDPEFREAVMQFLGGWNGTKGYHILFWKSRFTPQEIEGRRLQLMLSRLCPTACHYKNKYEFDTNTQYVVSSTPAYDPEIVQRFTNYLI